MLALKSKRELKAPRRCPRKTTKNIEDAVAELAEEKANDIPHYVIGLPGDNPYDDAVANRGFDYATARQREDVMLVNEKTKQARLATESAKIALDREKLALDEQRGVLISREVYLEKQEALVATFKELISLITTDCSVKIPAGIRDDFFEQMEAKVERALHAVAIAAKSKQSRADVMQTMSKAFKGGE